MSRYAQTLVSEKKITYSTSHISIITVCVKTNVNNRFFRLGMHFLWELGGLIKEITATVRVKCFVSNLEPWFPCEHTQPR